MIGGVTIGASATFFIRGISSKTATCAAIASILTSFAAFFFSTSASPSVPSLKRTSTVIGPPSVRISLRNSVSELDSFHACAILK